MTGSGRQSWQSGGQQARSAGKKPDLDGYVEVPQRIAEFYAKYPDGILRTRVQPDGRPYSIEKIEGQLVDIRTGEMVVQSALETFLVVVAEACRAPGEEWVVGCAWEAFPGRTPYTRGSELQNAETSAWGRALGALGIGSSKSVASFEEVRNRQAEREEPLSPVRRLPSEIAEDVRGAKTDETLKALFVEAGRPGAGKGPTVPDWDDEPVPLGDLIRAAKAALATVPDGA